MHAATRQFVLAQAGNTGIALTVMVMTSLLLLLVSVHANKADATTLAIAINDVFIRNAGDNMDSLTYTPGNIQNNVAWPINNNNIFDCAGGFDVPEPAAGFAQNLTGLIRFAQPPTGWVTTNGIFQFSGGTPPAMTGACVVPYLTAGTEVLIGQPTTDLQ